MNILALETSSADIGIAAVQIGTDVLSDSAQILAVLSSAESRQLSRHIITLLDGALQKAGWAQGDVDVLAVGLGPGSWTGLRIGLTTAKTLAQVRGWQLVGVPVFDAMAQAVWRNVFEDESTAHGRGMEHFLLLVTAPCRPGEVYGKIYECHEEFLAVAQSEWIGSPQLMAHTLGAEAIARDLAAPLVLVGQAAPLVSAVLGAGQEHVVSALSAEAVVVEVAIAGAVAVANGEAADALTLQPLYLAPSAAERNLRS